MPTIQWTEAMSVGVEALDRDHKHLIHLINGLHYSDASFVELFNEQSVFFKFFQFVKLLD